MTFDAKEICSGSMNKNRTCTRRGEGDDGAARCVSWLLYVVLPRGMAMMSREQQAKLQGRHQLDFMYQEPPGYKDRTWMGGVCCAEAGTMQSCRVLTLPAWLSKQA